MKNAIIFGCGAVGIKAKNMLQREGYHIIAFADNDSDKWGKFIDDIEIVEPRKIVHMEPDIIAIGIYKAAYKIKEQLLEYGVLEERIVIPIQPKRIFENPNWNQEVELNRIEQADYEAPLTVWYNSLSIQVKDQEFLQKVEQLKMVLEKNRIPRNNVCVVSGAVLQALGLRESKKFDDLDIIMTSDLREIYGKGLVIISESAEMHPQNEYDVLDDEIINNPEMHFVFRDIKFMHPRILYSYGEKRKLLEYKKLEDYLK